MSNNPWQRVDDEVAGYNRDQYSEMYRSTNFVIECLKNILEKDTAKYKSHLNILDVGCSAGANLYHISQAYKQHNFTGIDLNLYFLNEAKKTYRSYEVENVNFVHSDFIDYSFLHDIIGSSQ